MSDSLRGSGDNSPPDYAQPVSTGEDTARQRDEVIDKLSATMGPHSASDGFPKEPKSRISKSMTLSDAMFEIYGGGYIGGRQVDGVRRQFSPGARDVCIELSIRCEMIDPDSLLGAFGYLIVLDELGVYDSRLYELYRQCGGLTEMLAVLRACQLGGLAGATPEAINSVIDNKDGVLDIPAVLTAVHTVVPNFNASAGRQEGVS